MKKLLIKTDNFFSNVESVILILILTVMIFFSSLQIVLRSVFNKSVIWFDPFLRSLVLWTAFIGGAKAVKLSRNIKIDILERFLKEKTSDLLKRILSFISCVICFYLFYLSVLFVREEKAFGEIFFLQVKVWHIELAFPTGLFLMGVHSAVKIFYPKESI